MSALILNAVDMKIYDLSHNLFHKNKKFTNKWLSMSVKWPYWRKTAAPLEFVNPMNPGLIVPSPSVAIQTHYSEQH
jgi:hypothetical protein